LNFYEILDSISVMVINISTELMNTSSSYQKHQAKYNVLLVKSRSNFILK